MIEMLAAGGYSDGILARGRERHFVITCL